ncbi:MAG TPA: methyl-accepting chemotaxis protein [Gemmatimonadaceae bacterium]|nr:methyl-accepting chemotaxis protein [Gemmatimonadaceae bacterium]
MMLPFRNTGGQSSRSLRRRIVTVGAIAALVVLGALGYSGLVILKKMVAGDEDAHIVNAASLSKQLVERLITERARQVELIASEPTVIAAAKKGAQQARDRKLPTMSNEQLETMFKAARSQQVDEATKQYLTALLPKLDIAEVMLTDEYGYNAVTTSPSSDFVQSDEAWWMSAWNSGLTTAQATADPATQRTVVELAGVVRDGTTRVGVVKVKFGLAMVDSVLAQGSVQGNELRVDLVDSAGKVIASSGLAARFKRLPGYTTVIGRDPGVPFDFASDSVLHRGAVEPTNGGRWRVVAHMTQANAARAYDAARSGLILGIVAMLAVIVLSLSLGGRFIERRITGPAEQLAKVAEAVAAGDFSRRVSGVSADDEIGRLSRAVSAMIDELHRLATALRESAAETGSMTQEITASSEEMAASAGQIAHTAADLSQQANTMAETIQALAGSSEHLVNAAASLDSGATEGVDRNARLRALALDNRARLDESTRSLAALRVDVEASAAAISELAKASEEVRSFVALVQKLARQSKLLALNAAMEAARAGEHGHGFAVVAEEVRRLAAMSSEAAERTEQVVNEVLAGIDQSRASSERTVDTVRGVRDSTEQGSRSFGQIEAAVAEADGWTTSIQQAVGAASTLVRDMRSKLDSLAAGTESFAAAMEEVAASSQEQSASTEQIAAAASTLSGAAERLTRLVANLKLASTDAHTDSGASAPSSTEPAELRTARALATA